MEENIGIEVKVLGNERCRKPKVVKRGGKYEYHLPVSGDCGDDRGINRAIEMIFDARPPDTSFFLGIGEAWERIFGEG